MRGSTVDELESFQHRPWLPGGVSGQVIIVAGVHTIDLKYAVLR